MDAFPKGEAQADDLAPGTRERQAVLRLQAELNSEAAVNEEMARLQHWIDIAGQTLRLLIRITLRA